MITWQGGLNKTFSYVCLAFAVFSLAFGHLERAVFLFIVSAGLLSRHTYEMNSAGVRWKNIIMNNFYKWDELEGWSTMNSFGYKYLVIISKKGIGPLRKKYFYLPENQNEVKKILAEISKHCKKIGKV